MDAEGGKSTKTGNVIMSSFSGNVNFSDFKQIQEDYGLNYKIDISVTTDFNGVKIGDFIKFNDITYEVRELIPFDTHNLIIGVKFGN